ncbi:MAG: AAA family ATPase [bacterium]|nr:AAA family ATPase [bacterium]
MYLKSLEINGFKSFAKKANLEFGTAIVGIVGPNGSGKSNVAEAFRFALGEQSMKSMRGKRGEDMIFNGGKTLPKMNRAGVKLTFDNTRKIFNIDFDEVVLERVVHRDGVNEYLINGSQVRHRDILELLAGANIGSSGHHIISQGEADRILNSSIKERKAMIEDALGLKVYQYKREESSKKLEKTSENIKQVESLRREIAPHIKFLEKQVEKVKKAEELRSDLVLMYQEYLGREEGHLHLAKQKLNSEREEPVLEFEAIEKKIAQYKKIISESEERDKKSGDLLRIEEELQVAEEEESNVKNSLSRLEGEISAQKKALSRAESHAQSSFTGTISVSDLENLHRDILAVADAGKTNDNISFLRGIIERIVASLSKFIDEKKSVEAENTFTRDIESEIKKLEGEHHNLATELNKAEVKKGKVKEEYDAFRKMREEESSRERVAERELFALMNRRTELNSVLFSFRAREEEIHREEESFKMELSEAQALLGQGVLHFKVQNFEGEERVIQLDRRKKLERLKIRLEEAGGAGGEEVTKEFEEVTARDQFLSREIDDLHKSAETLQSLITELKEKLVTEFKIGISKFNDEFSKFFALMFGGGGASLSVIKEEKRQRKSEFDIDVEDNEEEGLPAGVESDETEAGIDISVSLPNKRTKGLAMLSGGERALTSIALLFAISQVNPPPFIILDETDAALDEANSRKYGDMVENLSKHSQLILITHNRETMSRAGILYGVTMGSDGYSKLLSVKFDEAVAVAK